MAGAQAHSAIAVVILVEEQALVPVWVFLKFAVEAEASSPAVGPAFENRNHAVSRFPRDFARGDGLILAARRRQRELPANGITKTDERVDQQV